MKDERLYRCPECGEVWRGVEGYTAHLWKVHGLFMTGIPEPEPEDRVPGEVEH